MPAAAISSLPTKLTNPPLRGRKNAPFNHIRDQEIDFYAQDNWKITPRLTHFAAPKLIRNEFGGSIGGPISIRHRFARRHH